MMVPNKFAICFFLATLGWLADAEEIIVDIPQGSLKGIKATTVLQGKPMYSFKGIPYAKPNVGPNKFRLPEAADPWNGVLDATQHKSTCVFYCMVRQGLFGEEDCLYLNVYTPEVNKDARKAVMVFFHPGGFNGGSGDDDIFGADFLVEHDVVVVTMNFRLGAIGFLNTGDASAPGNVGLKDQVMALRWIKDNIYHFGGCMDRVTIFGHSSGGAMVQYHMMSPMSQGLFKGAIQQSGSPQASWAYNNMPREAAFMLGESLGVKTTDSGELVKKLAEFSAKELVDASAQIAKTGFNGFMHLFIPSAEANVGQEIFLPADPWELIKSGKIADVPLMTGLTADEASFCSGTVLEHASMIDDNFDLFIPTDLNMTDPAMRKETGEAIKKFYMNGQPVSKDTTQEITNLLTDVMFAYGTALSSKIINSRNTAPVYEYLFTFYAPFGVMKSLFGVEEGVSHGDELTYEFYSNAFKNKPDPGTPTEKMIKMLTELWTNFAKESNPTPNTDGIVKVTWEPKGHDDNYLEINLEPTMKKGMLKDRVSFWADIYKNVLGNYSKLFA